ncbi:uncharacterized protein TNCV_885501 [Trichonephila clavipes]|nr:uncharacterized protein TNCV_885501 [Trichonephila clavipes]
MSAGMGLQMVWLVRAAIKIPFLVAALLFQKLLHESNKTSVPLGSRTLVHEWYEGNHPGAALLGTGSKRDETTLDCSTYLHKKRKEKGRTKRTHEKDAHTVPPTQEEKALESNGCTVTRGVYHQSACRPSDSSVDCWVGPGRPVSSRGSGHLALGGRAGTGKGCCCGARPAVGGGQRGPAPRGSGLPYQEKISPDVLRPFRPGTPPDHVETPAHHCHHLRNLTFKDGNKVFPTCERCTASQASPEYILDCLGLSKQDLYEDPLMMLDFLRSWTWSSLARYGDQHQQIILKNCLEIQ